MENYNYRDSVIYIGSTEEQVLWGNNDDPREVLVEGAIYYVEKAEIHSQHTKLTLRGIKGKFNSVSFKKI